MDPRILRVINAGKQLSKAMSQIEALIPVANLDIHHLTWQPDDTTIWGLNDSKLTVGDIRRAKRAMGHVDTYEYDPAKRQGPVALPPLGEMFERGS